MKKIFIISILFTVASLAGIIMLLNNNGKSTAVVSNGQANVTVVGGKQVIQIDAKGGYAPRNTVAKANMPTTLNLKTNGTFDCSSGVSIPSLGFRTSLPPSGVTPVEIPPQPAGTVLKGTCSMGMYNFAVNFN
jgi:plastocyanin domain-containing protein